MKPKHTQTPWTYEDNCCIYDADACQVTIMLDTYVSGKNAHTLQDTFGREYFSYMGDYDNVIQTIYAEAKKICEQMEKTHRSNLFRAA